MEICDEDVFVPHPIAASLSEPQALRVGLPPSIKMALQIDTKGLITSPDFRLSYRWIDDANRSIRGDRKGVILSISGGEYRLPEPLFGLIEAIDEFASSPGHEDAARMASLARLQELIPGGAGRSSCPQVVRPIRPPSSAAAPRPSAPAALRMAPASYGPGDRAAIAHSAGKRRHAVNLKNRAGCSPTRRRSRGRPSRCAITSSDTATGAGNGVALRRNQMRCAVTRCGRGRQRCR